MKSIEGCKQKVRKLKQEIYALYLACKDPRVPWHIRVIAACVVGYAFSPIDLIPDMIPVLGFVDDLILVPLGIGLVIRLMPRDVLEDCQERARAEGQVTRPANWAAAAIIVAVWLLLAGLAVFVALHFL